MQDPYCYPNSRVLKNKLDIQDLDELHDAERRLAKYRAEELLNSPIVGVFDFEHLKAIHKYLFQDIYEWAGEIRTVDIAKGHPFCRYFAIDAEARRIFSELKEEKFLQGLSIGELGGRLAYYLAELNALHPFREGNGRTQREFVRQLAMHNNLFLSYAGITEDETVEASVASLGLNYAPMEKLILTHLRPF